MAFDISTLYLMYIIRISGFLLSVLIVKLRLAFSEGFTGVREKILTLIEIAFKSRNGSR